MDIRQDLNRYPVIYGTGGETSQESSETREITLPRTSYDLLNQDLPTELALAKTRRCRTLKKQMQMSCRVIDMNMHFVEQTLTRRGGLGILRLCKKAITDSFQSLQKVSDEFTDILRYTDSEVVELSVIELVSDAQDCVDSALITLDDILEPFRDWKEASGNGDDNTYESKPSRENQSESGTVDGPPHRRDDRPSLSPSRREGPPPGLAEVRPSLPPSRREGPPPGLVDDRRSLPPSRREGPPPEHFDNRHSLPPSRRERPPPGHFDDRQSPPSSRREVPVPGYLSDCQSLPPSRPGHCEINDGDSDATPVRPTAELDDSHDDVNADVPPAGRAKLGSRMIKLECRQDEVDLSERPYIRDVKQQESGKEQDELTVLRYQSSKHHRYARGRRR